MTGRMVNSSIPKKMPILIVLICALLLIAGPLFAATYYMPDNFPSLQAAMAGMSGGDTLVIRDGVYTGADNVIDHNHLPPSGTAAGYTVIRAENDGQAVFDGQGLRQMMYLVGRSTTDGPHHIRFEGVQWRNSSSTLVTVALCSYIKLMRCSCYDASGSGDGGDGFGVSHCNNVLLEDCWSWGASRKHFYIGNSAEKIVVRRCVARHDRHSNYFDQESFMAYDCWDVEFQNCIAIDGDQGAYITPSDITTAKAFCTRNGGSGIDVRGIFYRGCISIGNDAMLGWVGSNVTHHSVIDCIHWDSAGGSRIRAAGSRFDHCTFGNVTGTGTWSPLAYLEAGDTITNSLLHNAYYGIWNASSSSDYNALYSVTDEYVGSSVPGSNDLSAARGTSVDALDGTPGDGVAALKYLVRIEDGSSLDGRASDGRDIGATVLKRIGISGTLWGEAGYNSTTTRNLWPFPYENLIRSQMRSYSYDSGRLTGNRGFCADGQTLTKYVWEYLGNPIPPEVYESQGDVTPPVSPTGIDVQVN